MVILNTFPLWEFICCLFHKMLKFASKILIPTCLMITKQNKWFVMFPRGKWNHKTQSHVVACFCSVWGELEWDMLIYNPCFCNRGMLTLPLTAPECSPLTGWCCSAKLHDAFSSENKSFKMHRPCGVHERVCCSCIIYILNLFACRRIILNHTELQLRKHFSVIELASWFFQSRCVTKHKFTRLSLMGN